jgi:hypothetical protein
LRKLRYRPVHNQFSPCDIRRCKKDYQAARKHDIYLDSTCPEILRFIKPDLARSLRNDEISIYHVSDFRWESHERERVIIVRGVDGLSEFCSLFPLVRPAEKYNVSPLTVSREACGDIHPV